jgi:hypothetical protein
LQAKLPDGGKKALVEHTGRLPRLPIAHIVDKVRA